MWRFEVCIIKLWPDKLLSQYRPSAQAPYYFENWSGVWKRHIDLVFRTKLVSNATAWRGVWVLGLKGFILVSSVFLRFQVQCRVSLQLLLVTKGNSGEKRCINHWGRKRGWGGGPGMVWMRAPTDSENAPTNVTPYIESGLDRWTTVWCSVGTDIMRARSPDATWGGSLLCFQCSLVGFGAQVSLCPPGCVLCSVVLRWGVGRHHLPASVIFLSAQHPPPEGPSTFWSNVRNLIFNVKRETV